MDCKACRCKFSEWMDGELDSGLERSINDHLNQCPECAAQAKWFRGSLMLVHGLTPLEAPPDFVASVHKKIESANARRGILSWPGRFFNLIPMPSKAFGLAATILIIFGIGVLVGKHSDPAGQAPPLMAEAYIESDAHSLEPLAGDGTSVPIDVSWVDTRPRAIGGLSDIETPSDLIMAILRTDPDLAGHERYSELQGATVLTEQKLFLITISTADFLKVRDYIESGRGRLPRSLAEAVNLYPQIRVKVLPSPLSPLPGNTP